MTDPGTLSADVQMLVRYGREQYEDAAIYHAVAQYVSGIGQIPSGAWGELPWSGHWQQRWEKAWTIGSVKPTRAAAWRIHHMHGR